MEILTKNLFTSESVGKGHPDKICDQISDLILEQCLKNDPNSKVACEVLASNRLIVIAGEITTHAYVDVVKCAWDVVLSLGYSENDFTIISNVNKQSSDIFNAVVHKDGDIGAGDQGIVFGYATNETTNYMPLTLVLSHELVKKIELDRISNKIWWLKSDCKSQVTIDYTNLNNLKIDTMLVSVQHDQNVSNDEIKKYVESIMDEIANKYKLNLDFKKIINPSNKFVIGGPIGDTGLTGRKIIVDTYGGICSHGGGAFSGKDPSKVDRTGAYFARWIAKNAVAAGLANKIQIQLAFAIGINKPIAININCFDTNKYELDKIQNAINMVFDYKIKDMINELNLYDLPYSQLAVYGHFGRDDLDLSYEKLNKVKQLQEIINKL